MFSLEFQPAPQTKIYKGFKRTEAISFLPYCS